MDAYTHEMLARFNRKHHKQFELHGSEETEIYVQITSDKLYFATWEGVLGFLCGVEQCLKYGKDI